MMDVGKFTFDQVGLYRGIDMPQAESIEKITVSSGWPEFDNIFLAYPGQFVMVTGKTSHGKSGLLFNLMSQYQKIHGISSFFYIPENQDFWKETMRDIYQNDSEFDAFLRYYSYVQSADVDDYKQPQRTLHWVLDRAITAIERGNVSMLVIDPFNELERAKRRDQLLTDYIGECLQYLTHFARLYRVTIFFCAHPTKSVGKDDTPDLYDIEGSAHWANKCDNGLVVDRQEGATCRVISQKVRRRGSGKRGGQCFFHVDNETGKFTPEYGASG